MHRSCFLLSADSFKLGGLGWAEGNLWRPAYSTWALLLCSLVWSCGGGRLCRFARRGRRRGWVVFGLQLFVYALLGSKDLQKRLNCYKVDWQRYFKDREVKIICFSGNWAHVLFYRTKVWYMQGALVVATDRVLNKKGLRRSRSNLSFVSERLLLILVY